MKLEHLLKLVEELPQNTTLNYVRGTDTCKFSNVDIEGERINSISPTGESKSWAPSYLQELAPKIIENEPFNLSGLLNNKGSFRPVLETILAHTREFYTVRKGTATALVWIPTKPKATLELEEISIDEVPPVIKNDGHHPIEKINCAIMNPLKASYSKNELAYELKRMYDSLGTVGIHLFGIKYGKQIVDYQVKDLSALATQAGVSETYGTELKKLCNVYTAIHERQFGVSFYEDIKIVPADIQNSIQTGPSNLDYLRAMRTKPFLLLAGISGTGKSRIVKQMAFESCPVNPTLRKDPTSPGNYCLVEVKPNWHDSTELLGYESKIGGAHYMLTPFVRFMVKALKHKDTPFFVCLDEMNLAPVEQYFAEFLSVLESRTKLSDGRITSEPLVKAGIFANKDYELKLQDDLFGLTMKEEAMADGKSRVISGELSIEDRKIYDVLKEEGLRIPENVVVIGTVNMDETTHQFSRKVIDRAMTIEMNLPEGEPFQEFFENKSELTYREIPASKDLYLSTEVKSADVVRELSSENEEETEWLKNEVVAFLTSLNDNLDGTPFKVAYRVQNELMLYFYQMWREDKTAQWNDILRGSCDQILMMKVLPRIEGDEELLEKPLENLASFFAEKKFKASAKKIAEMKSRLTQSHFTSFWP